MSLFGEKMSSNNKEKNPRENPYVSVVIPAYRIAGYLGEGIASVVAQTFTDFEIIVINDGSPDTAELERVIAPFLDRIVYIKQDNQGAGAARNAGLRAARGKYIAFLDGDDLWEPNHLKQQIALIESGPGYDLVYADSEIFGQTKSHFRTCMEANPSVGELTFESLLAGRCSVNTSTVVARREPILEVGLFDTTLRNAQDFDLWLRLAKRPGARMTYQRAVLGHHRIYPGSLSSDDIRSLEAEVRVLTKTLQNPNLTVAEQATINETIPIRRATIEVLRGKRQLLDGELDAATKSFAESNSLAPSWKLRLVLFWMRTAPRLFYRIYKARAA
jgi:glycosyltransferase involved in cell wall biosynthesis